MHLGHIEPVLWVTEYLTEEVLVLAEDSVAAVAEAVADSDSGGKFKLQVILKSNLQKGRFLCQEAMVQARPVKVPVLDAVWAAARGKVKAGWADLQRQGRVEIVYAQAAVRQSLMLSGNPAINEVVQNVEQK
jgi:hypothetical protein